MAATTQLALPVRATSPLALWHQLSLDAPTVATVWTWFIARTSHIRLPPAAAAAMVLTVWILYAADRLLDARLSSNNAGLEARHLFHHRHCRAFVTGIALAVAALAALLQLLDPAALRLYHVEGTLLLAWFVILHATQNAHRLPKEIAVGLFFSAAVFIPTVAREPALRLLLAPAAFLLAALCSLNCLFIYKWEHTGAAHTAIGSRTKPAHATTRLALAHLPAIAALVAIAGLTLTLFQPTAAPIPAACALSAFLLLALDRNRLCISRLHLRAAADLALLTPLLLLPFLRHFSR